jgi:hypothetical protein
VSVQPAHRTATDNEVHRPFRWTFANAAARTAINIGAIYADDVGCLAWQQDDNSTWLAKATGTGSSKWQQVGSALDITSLTLASTPTLGSYLPLYDGVSNKKATLASLANLFGVSGFRNFLGAGAHGDGATSDATLLQSELNAAQAKCETVYMPPTAAGYLIDAAITIPAGVRLLGAFSGARRGLPTAGLSTRGSTVVVPTSFRGKLFTVGHCSTVEGIEVFYKDQQTVGTPDVYDYTFDLSGNSSSVINCSLPNAYRGFYCHGGGHRIDNIDGWCISEGVHLGRVFDVARITNVHFNPSAWPAGSGLLTWHNANGFPFTVDGAEEFYFSGCFSYGGLIGLRVQDIDADGFQGSYGTWVGGGWDTALTGMQVFSGIDARGIRISDVGIIPSGAGGGVGVKISDNLGSISQYQKPKVMMNNVAVWQGATYDRAVWIETNSQATVIWSGGYVYDTGEGVLVQSTTAHVRLWGVEMKDSALRINNAGPSPYVEDEGGITGTIDPNHPSGAINFGTIGANSNVQGNIAVSWLAGTEQISVSATGPLPNGISISNAWCSAGLVWVALSNGTSGGVVVGSVTFRITISRR